ncbi:unnamed protein product [Amoebophrya sp. A25]|nr:unnamed protein product [Amoebophrya sp. A25]|eukprot:GSA25T00006964001.1
MATVPEQQVLYKWDFKREVVYEEYPEPPAEPEPEAAKITEVNPFLADDEDEGARAERKRKKAEDEAAEAARREREKELEELGRILEEEKRGPPKWTVTEKLRNFDQVAAGYHSLQLSLHFNNKIHESNLILTAFPICCKFHPLCFNYGSSHFLTSALYGNYGTRLRYLSLSYCADVDTNILRVVALRCPNLMVLDLTGIVREGHKRLKELIMERGGRGKMENDRVFVDARMEEELLGGHSGSEHEDDARPDSSASHNVIGEGVFRENSHNHMGGTHTADAASNLVGRQDTIKEEEEDRGPIGIAVGAVSDASRWEFGSATKDVVPLEIEPNVHPMISGGLRPQRRLSAGNLVDGPVPSSSSSKRAPTAGSTKRVSTAGSSHSPSKSRTRPSSAGRGERVPQDEADEIYDEEEKKVGDEVTVSIPQAHTKEHMHMMRGTSRTNSRATSRGMTELSSINNPTPGSHYREKVTRYADAVATAKRVNLQKMNDLMFHEKDEDYDRFHDLLPGVPIDALCTLIEEHPYLKVVIASECRLEPDSILRLLYAASVSNQHGLHHLEIARARDILGKDFEFDTWDQVIMTLDEYVLKRGERVVDRGEFVAYEAGIAWRKQPKPHTVSSQQREGYGDRAPVPLALQALVDHVENKKQALIKEREEAGYSKLKVGAIHDKMQEVHKLMTHPQLQFYEDYADPPEPDDETLLAMAASGKTDIA